jgi:voltage-gated potassium channel
MNKKIIGLLLIYILIVLVSAGFFSHFEGKNYADSLWWACVTAMTVGYGDMYPATYAGKMVSVVLMHSSVLMVLPILMSYICSALIKDQNELLMLNRSRSNKT